MVILDDVTNTSFAGQTFTPAVGGTLVRVDAFLFCASCSGANPNIILEVRTTSGGNPVMTAGGLLATATIAGNSSASPSMLPTSTRSSFLRATAAALAVISTPQYSAVCRALTLRPNSPAEHPMSRMTLASRGTRSIPGLCIFTFT